MSDKVDLLRQGQVTTVSLYDIVVMSQNVIAVYKDGREVTIPELTGKNIHDLDPAISFDDVIAEYETRTSRAPIGKFRGIKTGFMNIVGGFGKKSQKKTNNKKIQHSLFN